MSRPHHTISDVGLIGGGQVPLPGEVSLAHHGMLVLAARPACRRHGLEGLRHPLERGCHRHMISQSVLTLSDVADFANRLLTASRPGRVQGPPITTVTVLTPAV